LATLTLTPPVTGAIAGGNNNDFTPVGGNTASVWRLTAGGLSGGTITGIALSGGNPDGRVLIIQDVSTSPGTHNISFTSEDVNSAAVNRIITPKGAAFTMPIGGAALLIYDGTISRWRLIGIVSTTLPLDLINGSSLNITGDTFFSGFFQGQPDAVAAAGAQNNYNPGGHWPRTQNLFLAAGAALSITGLDSTGVNIGWVINFVNASSVNSITFVHNSGASLAANRFMLPNNVNYVLPPNGVIGFMYTFGSVWQLVGGV
jgi:hypothetical protein